MRLALLKFQLYFVFRHIQLAQRRQSFPKFAIVQQKPFIIRGAGPSESEQYDFSLLNLHFSAVENGPVEHDGRREELAPREHGLQIGSTDQVVQIALSVHSGHVEDEIFLVFALGDVDGGSWHF